MSEIELRNEDGKIVGYDPETGDTIPVSFEALDADDAQADRAVIDDNQSVARFLENDGARERLASAAYYNGSYYASLNDGSERAILRTDDPWSTTDLTDWEELDRQTNVNTGNRDLMVTSQGTFLEGFDGSIWRSTDGSSWSRVFSLTVNDDSIWALSESANGDIIAAQYNDDIALYQSSDDGATWTQIADGNDFPDFTAHLHDARYHPADANRIMVMGGDNSRGWYVSADNGATWTFRAPIEKERMTAVQGHPTDPDVYFIGEDDVGKSAGVLRVEDDFNSANPASAWRVLDTNSEFVNPSSWGSFSIRAIHDETSDDPTDSYYITSSTRNIEGVYNDDVYVSDTLEGETWRKVATGVNGARSYLQQAGAHGDVIDPNEVDAILGNDVIFRSALPPDVTWGVTSSEAVDKRYARAPIGYPSALNAGRQGFVFHFNDTDDAFRIIDAIADQEHTSKDEWRVGYANGEYFFQNVTQGYIAFRWEVDSGNFRLGNASNGVPLLMHDTVDFQSQWNYVGWDNVGSGRHRLLRVIPSDSGSESELNYDAPWWYIRNGETGNTMARINVDTGDMEIAGSLTENASF